MIDCDKEDQRKELEALFFEFAANYPQSALSLITGMFVGLLEFGIKASGGDENKEIKVYGCGNRDITISEVHKS